MASRRRAPLSKRAVGLLGRLAAAQRALDAFPRAEAVLKPVSSDWDSLHVLCQRLLVEPLDGGRLRLTRDGWRLANGR